ncbi:MAG TPA: hypothetical protein VJG32_02945 [Anaerolineae bacterium]|nr:hypothetical protein [Anaerolineae bacterium]
MEHVTSMTRKKLSPMRTFDPHKVGYYEKENWVAYYQKRWLRLLRVSVGMVKHAFGLAVAQAVYAAYLVARAEIAAAPFPDNDIPLAEKYMRRFYAFIRRVHREDFDVDQAARLEVNWWVVHRRLFGQTDNEELIDALAQLYAAAYQAPYESVRQAAYHRAQAMVYSDRWVNEGRVENSPLLVHEEEELVKSYAALREAVG